MSTKLHGDCHKVEVNKVTISLRDITGFKTVVSVSLMVIVVPIDAVVILNAALMITAVMSKLC